MRQHLDRQIIQDGARPVAAPFDSITDHDLVAAHVQRVSLHAQQVKIVLNSIGSDQEIADTTDATASNDSNHDTADEPEEECSPRTVLVVPWTPWSGNLRKGITHEPAGKHVIDPQMRAALLAAMSKARAWIDDLLAGQAGSFAEIARREQKGERHIRLLAPLAFVSPKIISAITAGNAPASLTVSALARSLPHLWSDQEQLFRIG